MAFGTPTYPYAGDFLVYIAGVETPVESVQITYGVGVIPAAVITMLPDEQLYRLGSEDRLPVAVFYLDQWYGNSKEYRLIFDGDITGWSYAKSRMGRSLVFQCQGHVSVLMQLYSLFIGGDADSVVQSQVSGSAQTMSLVQGDMQRFPLALFRRGMGQSKGGKFIERPIEFIINILNLLKVGGTPKVKTGESDGVSYDESTGEFDSATSSRVNSVYEYETIDPTELEPLILGKMSSAMQFFIKYNHKTKLDKRWVSSKFGDMIFGSLNEEQKVKYPVLQARITDVLMNAVSGQVDHTFGANSSFLDLVNAFYNSMFYDVLMLPTASYVKVNKFITPTTTEAVFDRRLTNNIVKPYSFFALPPLCNLLFPSTTEVFSYNEDYISQNTRVYMGSRGLFNLMTGFGNTSSTESQDVLLSNAMMVGAPTNVLDYVRDANKLQARSDKSLLIYPEEYFKGPVLTTVAVPNWFTYYRMFSDISNSSSEKKTEQEENKGVEISTSTTGDPIQDGLIEKEEAKLVAKEFQSKFDGLFSSLANYEYFRQRYSYRVGNMGLVFNPYIVPGFPAIMFDRIQSGLHTILYPTTVTQMLSSVTGLSTNIQYTHGRTLEEMYEEVFAENKTSKDKVYSMAPKIPIEQLAEAYQLEDNAGELYKNLFYTESDKQNSECVYDHKRYFTSTLPVSADSKAVFPGKVEEVKTAGQDTGIKVALNFKDTEGNTNDMTDYDSAMHHIARPICTLEQYITFIKGDKIGPFQRNGSNKTEAIAYVQIKKYSPGPNAFVEPNTNSQTGNYENIRRDWVNRLLTYRENVYAKRTME